MKPISIPVNKSFVGRKTELERLHKIAASKEASIIVMYGRRRIGKTELLEQAFRERNLLKFEGIEGLPQQLQFANVLSQLAKYTRKPSLAQKIVSSWNEFFQMLASYVQKGEWTVYFEEVQWLAQYESTFVSELKYVWDNYFRRNPNLVLILCGSAPSFMLKEVVHSKALYNRSQHEFHLKELSVIEVRQFLKRRSDREALDLYLTLGGVPEYLKWVSKGSSIFLGLCAQSFTPGSFFSCEYERIFTSSLSQNKHYRKVIEILSNKRFASRKDLMSFLKTSSGGSLSDVLLDLEQSGFIERYVPFYLGEKSMLSRYAISDNYLQYYWKFIHPLQKNIASGAYVKRPYDALRVDSYMKWLGFSFERFCRKFHFVIATILRFSGVHYRSGAFFSKATEEENAGYQMDLVFDRADHVYTVCEIKYMQGKVGVGVIRELQRKLDLFPNPSGKTIHKVLICNEGAEESLLNRSYFDEVITAQDLLDPRNW